MRRSRLTLLPLVASASVMLSLSTSVPARADSVTAQALFDAGQAMMTEKRYDEACAKFAASMEQDRAVGTHYALADCHEQAGRLATAWAMYLDVEAEAHTQNRPDRVAHVHDRAAKLAPRLMKIAITVAPDAREATIKRDGKLVDAAQLGLAVPVDPGKHEITASAAGKKDWTTTVDASAEGQTYPVQVPKLEDATPRPPEKPGPFATAEPQTPGGGASPLRTAGWVIGGVGIVGLGVGAVSGIIASSNKSSHCDANNLCDAGTASSIKTTALVADVGWIAGGVLLAAGVSLILFAPSGKAEGKASIRSLRITPAVSARGAEWILGGSF